MPSMHFHIAEHIDCVQEEACDGAEDLPAAAPSAQHPEATFRSHSPSAAEPSCAVKRCTASATAHGTAAGAPEATISMSPPPSPRLQATCMPAVGRLNIRKLAPRAVCMSPVSSAVTGGGGQRGNKRQFARSGSHTAHLSNAGSSRRDLGVSRVFESESFRRLHMAAARAPANKRRKVGVPLCYFECVTSTSSAMRILSICIVKLWSRIKKQAHA